MFGMKPPRQNLPPIQLTAVVIRGRKTFRKALPLSAMNAACFAIFTPENIDAIRRFPDSIEETGEVE
jgi:hypothetical protein